MVAEQAVNLAAHKLAIKTSACQTGTTPVDSGHIDDFMKFLKQAVSQTSRGMDEEIIEHLIYTYGSEYGQLVNYNLSQRIDPLLPVTGAEVIHAVRHEMAVTLLDVIQRRTELGAAGLPSMSTLQRCADLMGQEAGWSSERRQREIDLVVQAYPYNQMERVTA